MGVTRLNHAILYVSDLASSVAFYSDVPGLRQVAETAPGLPTGLLSWQADTHQRTAEPLTRVDALVGLTGGVGISVPA